jgi:hypothetical protein
VFVTCTGETSLLGGLEDESTARRAITNPTRTPASLNASRNLHSGDLRYGSESRRFEISLEPACKRSSTHDIIVMGGDSQQQLKGNR